MVFIEQLHDRIRHDKEWRTWAKIVATLTTAEDVKFGCDHGIYHWTTVAGIAKDFVLHAGGNARDAMLADIAGLLHDCGLICGNDKHAENGAQIAKAFLQARYGDGRPLSNVDIEIIAHAIANHSDGTEMNNIIDVALHFADKIHVWRDRVYKTSSIILEEATKIKSIDYEITAAVLAVRYQVEDDFIPKKFFRWKKAYEAPQKAASFLASSSFFFSMINAIFYPKKPPHKEWFFIFVSLFPYTVPHTALHLLNCPRQSPSC